MATNEKYRTAKEKVREARRRLAKRASKNIFLAGLFFLIVFGSIYSIYGFIPPRNPFALVQLIAFAGGIGLIPFAIILWLFPACFARFRSDKWIIREAEKISGKSGITASDRLDELRKLREKGEITDDEYENKRKEIIRNL